MERVNGIEPSSHFRKADTHNTLYYQHIQTRLTWVDFSTILALLWQAFTKDPVHPTGTHPTLARMAGGFSAAPK